LSKHIFSRDLFWSKVDRNGDGCWPWKAGHFSTGYGAFKIGKKNYGAHVIAFLIAGGKITKSQPHVLHSCNNRGCVNPLHLRAGTPRDNVWDMVKCGDIARGDKHGFRLHPECVPHGTGHGMAKLTNAKVRAIRSEYEPYRMTRDKLASKYGVSKATINQILMRKTWRHVE